MPQNEDRKKLSNKNCPWGLADPWYLLFPYLINLENTGTRVGF